MSLNDIKTTQCQLGFGLHTLLNELDLNFNNLDNSYTNGLISDLAGITPDDPVCYNRACSLLRAILILNDLADELTD